MANPLGPWASEYTKTPSNLATRHVGEVGNVLFVDGHSKAHDVLTTEMFDPDQ